MTSLVIVFRRYIYKIDVQIRAICSYYVGRHAAKFHLQWTIYLKQNAIRLLAANVAGTSAFSNYEIRCIVIRFVIVPVNDFREKTRIMAQKI